MAIKIGTCEGSWKCGKGRSFTHIPTNLLFLNKEEMPKMIAKKNGGGKRNRSPAQYRAAFEASLVWVFDRTSE